jgi:hypothetical protein
MTPWIFSDDGLREVTRGNTRKGDALFIVKANPVHIGAALGERARRNHIRATNERLFERSAA